MNYSHKVTPPSNVRLSGRVVNKVPLVMLRRAAQLWRWVAVNLLPEIEPCPCCNLADQARPKLILIDPMNPTRATGMYRVNCACEGDLTVDSLRPEFVALGNLAQFIQALYCARCGIGYVPEHMAKPEPPKYQGSSEGYRRVLPDGTLGPLLQRIQDDPDAQAT
jgi:hypothetical protein